MATPFLRRVGEHPNGLTLTTFRDDEICGICKVEEIKGTPAWIPESCTPFEVSTSKLCTLIYQECARIFPSLRPNAHGHQTRHIFHPECLRPWLERKSECPNCRTPINPNAMLSTAQKLKGEMGRHPKIWGAIGGLIAGGLAEFAAQKLGISRNYVRYIAYSTLLCTYAVLSSRFKNLRPNQN